MFINFDLLLSKGVPILRKPPLKKHPQQKNPIKTMPAED